MSLKTLICTIGWAILQMFFLWLGQKLGFLTAPISVPTKWIKMFLHDSAPDMVVLLSSIHWQRKI